MCKVAFTTPCQHVLVKAYLFFPRFQTSLFHIHLQPACGWCPANCTQDDLSLRFKLQQCSAALWQVRCLTEYFSLVVNKVNGKKGDWQCSSNFCAAGIGMLCQSFTTVPQYLFVKVCSFLTSFQLQPFPFLARSAHGITNGTILCFCSFA